MDNFNSIAFERLLSPSGLLGLTGVWLGYRVVLALYNVSPFHPLSKFPGPKIAAASYLYEAYYDWILMGRYGRRIEKMHEQYGPIVRVSPDELHCSDPYFADEIYTGKPGRILKLEDEVYNYAKLAIEKMLRWTGKEAFEVKGAFNCYTADVFSQYAFGEPMGFIEQEGWEPNFGTWTSSFLTTTYMMRHNGFARRMADILPIFANYMGDDVKRIMHQMHHVIPAYIKTALANPDGGRVFNEILNSNVLPEEEKSIYRLSGEGFVFLVAGTETTAAILTVMTFHLLHQPKIYARLMKDLEGVDQNNLKWAQLEQRPYLWALVQEALRHQPGAAARSARIAREEELYYKSQDEKTQFVIPRGTPVSMTAMINHWDTRLFPDPDAFNPDRWLLPDGKPDYTLQKFLISFSKGSRVCVGESLALCEIYIMAALMAFLIIPKAELFETTIEDLTYDHDLVVLQTKKGHISTRIKIA
ncbi:trichodiene oxygenase [Fusarium tjaetaba]|uniref:Trichodiene oxygenase n=1 Tax=Fusarium tjaetaba TaxID=1567544 RepID=A0A8H5RL35_9HYPO|nr:trichodiene oxygenase [Fusarium tjaetaba]KAF5636746.1 trichodiene oxygenase [Fusarium tjaetaba]